MPKYNFRKYDLVRLKNGSSPIVVTRVGVLLAGRYLLAGDVERKYYDFVPYDGDLSEYGVKDVRMVYTGNPDAKKAIDRYTDDNPDKFSDEYITQLNYEEPEKEGENTMALYQVKGEEKYGIFLTKNSSGQFVLEMKGTGQSVEAFDENKLEEVVPYTVKVGTEHYIATKGSVELGDMLVNVEERVIRSVGKLDTKNKETNQELSKSFVRVVTEEIK